MVVELQGFRWCLDLYVCPPGAPFVVSRERRRPARTSGPGFRGRGLNPELVQESFAWGVSTFPSRPGLATNLPVPATCIEL